MYMTVMSSKSIEMLFEMAKILQVEPRDLLTEMETLDKETAKILASLKALI